MRLAPLFVLIRRLPFSLLAELGDRKGRAVLARAAAPSPWYPGPEVQRPWAPRAVLWNLAGRGAETLGAGVQGRCCTDPLCASGRGHLPGSARRRRHDDPGRGVPDARPRPLSRQSTGLSAIDRLSRSAVPFFTSLLLKHREGRPRFSPGEGAAGLQGSFSPGSPLLHTTSNRHPGTERGPGNSWASRGLTACR
jgi:hypothetical protein